MKRSSLVLALMAAGLCGLSSQAFAQSAQDFNDLRAELKALRAELNQLKAQQAQQAPAASASAWNDRLDTVELRQKDAVVLGDIPNSFRLPGSETSIRVYGFAEANLIKDFKSTAPGDQFSNLPEQPLASGNPSTGKSVLTGQTSRFGFVLVSLSSATRRSARVGRSLLRVSPTRSAASVAAQGGGAAHPPARRSPRARVTPLARRRRHGQTRTPSLTASAAVPGPLRARKSLILWAWP